MASIRRTLSPAYHNRSYQNGGAAFSVSTPSHSKLFSSAKQPSYLLPMPYLAALASRIPKFLDVVFVPRRKGHKSFGQWVFRCAVFFLLGLIVGMTPFGFTQVDDIKSHNVSLEIKNEPFVTLKLDANPSLKRDNIVREMVYLGVETQVGLNPRFDFIERRLLIVITPTYNRMLQAFYLNRLGQLLRLVPPPLLWIVVEMSSSSTETAEILRNIGVMYRHLVCTKNSSTAKDRGVHQRNTALEHIEHHKLDGIAYFADDDNIYSLELFENLRMARRFGTWPVAMLAQSKNKAILEGPVCNGSEVIGWHTNEKSKMVRRFHVDMSGFAFNTTILWDPKRWGRPTLIPIRQLDTVKEGFQETTFIQQVVKDESQMEGLAASCSRILNWHLHLEAAGFIHQTADFVVPI